MGSDLLRQLEREQKPKQSLEVTETDNQEVSGRIGKVIEKREERGVGREGEKLLCRHM